MYSLDTAQTYGTNAGQLLILLSKGKYIVTLMVMVNVDRLSTEFPAPATSFELEMIR